MKLLAALFLLIVSTVSVQAGTTEQHQQQIDCIAENIYWEARNQSVKGMIAVGLVTSNRVEDKRYPDTFCEVIYQGPTRRSWKNPLETYPVRHRCQFSWYCDGKADDIPDSEYDAYVYEIAQNIAVKIYFGNFFDDFTRGATHYHAYYVQPEWAVTKTRTVDIGDHIFYRWD